jgi:hypothetical protein
VKRRVITKLFPCDPESQQTPADVSVLTPLSEGSFFADFLIVPGHLWQTSDAKNGGSGSPGRIRTSDQSVNSRTLYH